MVGRVVTPTAVIAVGSYLMVNPVSIVGPEVEGGAGGFSIDNSATVPVYLVGPRPAQPGDMLLCRFIGHRWVAERSGTSQTTHTLVGCPCAAIPSSLYLHVQNAPPPFVTRLVWPATITWQTKPADLHVYNIASPGYFSDVYQGIAHLSDGTAYVASTFRYYFSCSLGFYVVSGLFTDGSPGGYPGSFPIMQWLIGLGGNTCTPFNLPSGSPASTVIRNQGVSLSATGPA